jgi:excisionase family DNA binding protein
MTSPLVVMSAAELRELITEAVAAALVDHAASRQPDPETVSGSEMAQRLGVSRTSMHRLRLEGCPALRLGDSYRFRPSAVLAWLESRSNESNGQSAKHEVSGGVAKLNGAKPHGTRPQNGRKRAELHSRAPASAADTHRGNGR